MTDLPVHHQEVCLQKGEKGEKALIDSRLVNHKSCRGRCSVHIRGNSSHKVCDVGRVGVERPSPRLAAGPRSEAARPRTKSTSPGAKATSPSAETTGPGS